jgi:succinyl-diaminopimelate desuccinylase
MTVTYDIKLLEKLISCQSITPKDDGVIDIIAHKLDNQKFVIYKLPFGENENKVHNIYAEIGSGKKNLCFSGHVDVVPPGPTEKWINQNPFKLYASNEILYGRGLVDMKGAISCFICAIEYFLKKYPDSSKYKISLLISGDEEGDSKNGMIKLIEWLVKNKKKIDDCIVCEPTSKEVIGDTIKIGRRGSITFNLKILGTQGHVAYPHLAENPISSLIRILHKIDQIELDQGNEHFQPSNLEITNLHVGNNVTNVITEKAEATFNIRFNNIQSEEKLVNIIKQLIKTETTKYELTYNKSGDAFILDNPKLANLVKNSIMQTIPKSNPALSTDGGTSDARFIKNISNVVELGLLNATAHKINESCSINDLKILSQIYFKIIENYFFDEMAK